MNASLRHRLARGESGSTNNGALGTVAYQYRFEFVGVRPLPPPDYLYRDAPVVEGTIELYGAERFLVESVDHQANLPVAVLRKVRS